MKKTFYNDYVKAMKKYARETFGFIPAKITKNKKKYSRKVEKISLRKMLEEK